MGFRGSNTHIRFNQNIRRKRLQPEQPSQPATRLRTETTVRRTIMIGSRTLVAAVLLSAAMATSANAQLPVWAQSEPAAFQAQYPDRDVLNGGALTPAGRMGLVLPGGAAPFFHAGNTATHTPHHFHR